MAELVAPLVMIHVAAVSLIHIASFAIRQVVWMLTKSTTLQHWPRPDEVVLAMCLSFIYLSSLLHAVPLLFL